MASPSSTRFTPARLQHGCRRPPAAAAAAAPRFFLPPFPRGSIVKVTGLLAEPRGRAGFEHSPSNTPGTRRERRERRVLSPPCAAAAAAPRAAVTPAAPTQPLPVPRGSVSLAPTQRSTDRGQGREKSFFPLSWLSPGMSSALSGLLRAVPTAGGRGHRCETPGDGHGRQASRVGCSAGASKLAGEKKPRAQRSGWGPAPGRQEESRPKYSPGCRSGAARLLAAAPGLSAHAACPCPEASCPTATPCAHKGRGFLFSSIYFSKKSARK